MRKLLHATAALSALLVTSMTANAADVYARPRPSPPPPAPVYAPPPFSWTGFYLGGNIVGPGLTVT
jgi:outer membrane immunogenic protein